VLKRKCGWICAVASRCAIAMRSSWASSSASRAPSCCVRYSVRNHHDDTVSVMPPAAKGSRSRASSRKPSFTITSVISTISTLSASVAPLKRVRVGWRHSQRATPRPSDAIARPPNRITCARWRGSIV